MNKLLRYSFLLLLTLISSVGFAQNTVTFTAGTDKGTDGGTAAKEVSLTKDGITLTATGTSNAGVLGRTDNYRFYQNSVLTISSTVGNINKVVFTCTASGTAKYGPGNFTDPSTGIYTTEDKVGTWTGDASSFTLTASTAQVRATKIEVTYTPNGDTPVPAVEKPTISGTTPFTDKTTVTITIPTGTTVYYTTDGSTPDDNGDEYTDPFELTATTTVKAVAYNAEGTAHSDVASMEFVKQGNITTTGAGTLASPYTVADVIALQNGDAAPSDSVYVAGKVSQAATSISSYGDANYYLSDDGTTSSQIEAYNSYYFKKAKYTDESQLPKAGDAVVLFGKITEYNKTIELARGNYLVSLNGKTSGDDTPVTPTDTVSYTVSQAIDVLTAKTETTDVVYVNGTVSKIDEINSQYGNATYYISDDGTTANQLQVFRGKYLNNEKFTSEDQLKVGDKVKIAGVLKNYVKDETTTQEVTNSWIVTLNASTPDEPTTDVVSLPYEETFASSIGKFTINDVTVPDGTTYVWKLDEGQHYMKASGYVKRTNKAAESWLVSPLIDLKKASDPKLTYQQTGKYFGTMADEASVWAKGENDTEWTQLTVPTYMTGNDWSFVNDTISLKAFVGKNIQIAFKYTSSEAAAGTWEIKNISVKEYGSETPVDTKGTEANPYTPSEVLALTTLPTQEVYVKGKVVHAVTGDDTYKNANYYISDDGTETGRLQVFRGKYLDGADFTSKELLEAGDEVVVKGTLTEYNKNKEIAQGSSIVTINGKKEGKTAGDIKPTDKGGSENPYTPSEVLALGIHVPASEVYVQGFVVRDVKGSDQYKNTDYYLNDYSTSTEQLMVYRGKYLDGADFTSDKTLKAGDFVIVKGKLGTFQGVPQVAAGSKIISINSATGIDSFKNDTINENAPIYNLAGQRVGKDYKGIVIQNGKKRINK